MIRVFYSRILSFTLCLSILIVSLFGSFSLFSHLSALEAQRNAQAKIDSLGGEISLMKKSLQESADKLAQADQTIAEQQKELEERQKRIEALTPETPNADGNKVAYLTFDDGPSKNTPAILSILKSYGAKATFFVLHSQNPEYMKPIVEQGHTIALHCFSHDYNVVYKDDQAYFDDLAAIQAEVREFTGVESKIVRLPGGSSNTVRLQENPGMMTRITQKLTEQGYRYFDWTVDSQDGSGRDIHPNKLLENIRKQAEGQDTINVLMHDANAKTSTLQALPLIIEYLRSQGYRFEAITMETPEVHHPVNN